MVQALSRSAALERLKTQEFELLIIGGGITGAGIARDAAMRGLSVALLEKNSFGSGTSSKSSKLIHGGIRYLEQLQFGLVREALKEREILLKQAPELVWPLAFVLPIYQGSKRSSLKVKTGLWIYDLYAGTKSDRKHKSLSREEIFRRFPQLDTRDLKSGFLFFDAQTDDLALTRALIQSAVQSGATAIENAELKTFHREQSRLVAAEFVDSTNGEVFRVRSKCFANASGPWVDSVCSIDDPQAEKKLRPTKGAHIVFAQSRFAVQSALLLFTPQDERVFFVIPWKNRTLVGTTDTDFQDSPDRVGVDAADIAYLLDAVNFYFPDAGLSSADIVESFAGLRPLLNQTSGSESQVSREHHIFESKSGLLTIAGGKLTSYRRMSEEFVDRVAETLKSRGHTLSLRPCQTASTALKPA